MYLLDISGSFCIEFGAQPAWQREEQVTSLPTQPETYSAASKVLGGVFIKTDPTRRLDITSNITFTDMNIKDMETQQTSERPLKKRQTSPQSLYQYSKRLASKGPLRKRPLRKQVTFSKYSEQLVFRTRSSFRERNCYSKSEVQLMKAQVMEEVCRIYELACTRFPQQQTGTAIQSMLQLGLIQYEEIIGIEHLMTPELVEDHVNGRRSHRAVVARTQDLLRKRAVSDEMAMIKLSKVAIISSYKQVKKAVCRAEMSWQADRVGLESNADIYTSLQCTEPQRGGNASTKINSRAAIAKSGRKVTASKCVARAA